MRPVQLLTLLLLAMSPQLSGCATILASRRAEVRFESNPTGANVLIDGVAVGRTPLRLRLDQRRNYVVAFERDSSRVVSYLRAGAEPEWIVFDLICGGLPIIVDAATGSWKALRTTSVYGDFSARPEGQALSPDIDFPEWQPGDPDPRPPYTVQLETGRVIKAAAIEPRGDGMIKLTAATGSTVYLASSKVWRIWSSDELDLTGEVLNHRRKVP